jgi:hypothetical protein
MSFIFNDYFINILIYIKLNVKDDKVYNFG